MQDANSRPNPSLSRREYLKGMLGEIMTAALGDGVPRVPSSEEVLGIRRETARHIESIHNLDATHSRIAPNIDIELENALFKARATYRAFFCRIFRINDLPNEIITNIFRYVVWSVPDPETGTEWRLWLTWTCRRWRTIALDDHTLWNAIWFRDKPPFDRSFAWFHRAGSAPLDLRIGREIGVELTGEQMEELLGKLFAKLSNIRMLLVVVQTWEPALVVLDKLRVAGQAGIPLIMERFELHRTGSPYIQIGAGYQPKSLREPMTLFGGAASPPLKAVSLNGIHINWESSLINNLTTLDLRRIPLDLSPLPSRFREILAGSPNLRKLCLDGAGPQLLLVDPSPPVLLKSLRTLVIADFSVQYARYVLCHISAPDVRELTLINMTGEDYSPLFHMMTGRFPKVQLLSLYTMEMANTPASVTTIVKWLQSMPDICYLRIASLQPEFLHLFLHDPRKLVDPAQECPTPRQILCPNASIVECHPNTIPQLVTWVPARAAMGAPVKLVYITAKTSLLGMNGRHPNDTDMLFRAQCTQLAQFTRVRLLPFGLRSEEEEFLMR
ncbi:hypothetical protein H0H81_012445 [Sphagnurus paluster]|uniref:F-box domain-containing protein n=1 Tax=Sphagnurus paluster TaxID=117069 RepID=A0A9P7FRT5_9AGAR|nr:hypothetical protein H0H81_012445 [Sphagnurus paluster]